MYGTVESEEKIRRREGQKWTERTDKGIRGKENAEISFMQSA